MTRLFWTKRSAEQRKLCPGPPLPADFDIQDQFHEPETGVVDQNPSLPSSIIVPDCNIHYVPPELLAAIMLLTQSDISPWTLEGRRWIYVTHVSRYWRQVSLNLPHLWTSVDTSWAAIATSFIRRSGTAPLSLKINLQAKSSWLECQAINFALTHFTRTKELHLSFDGVHELAKISSSLYRPGFTSVLQSLVSLETTNVHLPYPPGLLGNLKTLKVHWVGVRHHISGDFLSILSTLEYCTELESFELRNKSGSLPTDDVVPPSRIVCLPRLRHISLASHYSSTAIHLLNHLTLPELVSVVTSGYAEAHTNHPSVLPTLLMSLDSCLVSMYDSDVHAWFSSKANPERTMEVRLRLPQNPWGSMMADSFNIFQPVFRAAFSQLHSLFLIIGFSSLTSLSIPHPFPTTKWVEFLQRLPNLRELTFSDLGYNGDCDQSAATLLDALSPEENPITQVTMCCPLLQDITLMKISLKPDPKEKKYAMPPSPHRPRNPVFTCVQDSLWKFVRCRNREHSRLSKLDISECRDFSNLLVEELAPFVDEVLWKKRLLNPELRKVYDINKVKNGWMSE
ncbi:hypothetical protein BD410DRAFT_796049 [Rickenella mellea]|uniref:Uncharacterized protein n=1 Tax=Rickenella mellea TaxID=50990 RepID=A0A4Y7PL46_9AGAM|nr:hypothetical protein BD410DRAFT_796049 [Rickenella mellea]